MDEMGGRADCFACFMRPIPTGLMSGLAATVPMSVVMEAIRRALPPGDRDRLPQRKITQRLTRRVGVEDELDDGQHEALAWVSHFGYGATMGAIYGLLDERVRRRLSESIRSVPPVAWDAAQGTAFGLLVWAASYMGWLPAAGIMKPATRRRGSRNALIVTAHVVYGAALGLITGAVRRGG
jgi:hypothetical protein